MISGFETNAYSFIGKETSQYHLLVCKTSWRRPQDMSVGNSEGVIASRLIRRFEDVLEDVRLLRLRKAVCELE